MLFYHLALNISDTENPDESKRQIQKQVPGKQVSLKYKTFKRLRFLVSTKVSNLKFILRRLLKIDIGQDFELIITAKVCLLFSYLQKIIQ